MQTRKQDPEAIAEEAVGQRHGDPPPYALKEEPDMSQEEMARRLSKPAGPRASIPEKTAEAVGERVGDAYADPGSAAARNTPGKSLASLYRTRDFRETAQLILSSMQCAS